MAAMAPSGAIRTSVASWATLLPKPTGFTPEISRGPACVGDIMRSEILSEAWIEKVPETVPDHLKRKHGQDDRHAREPSHPVGLSYILPPGRDHGAPGRDLGADAEPEKRQASLREHRIGKDEGALDKDRRHKIAKHMARHDPPG